jgi:cardiolipin synthase
MTADKLTKKSELYKLDEDLYFNPNEFLLRFYDDLSLCQRTLDIEMYILTVDILTHQLELRFADLAKKGVKVRLIVDAVGASGWIRHRKKEMEMNGVQVRIFHPIPGISFIIRIIPQLMFFFSFLNRRDHKKLILIDEKVAYVGSFNLSQDSLDWRETILRLSTTEVANIQSQFNKSWDMCRHNFKNFIKNAPQSFSFLSLQNRRYSQYFIKLLDNAKKRIWLTTPYFHPPRALLRALLKASCRGVDVRLVVPEQPDVPGFQWIAQQHYLNLTQYNVQVYEYQKKILHAKSSLIDDLAIIGSGNLNFRSFMKDSELNVVAHRLSSIINLELQFKKDVRESRAIDRNYNLAWWKKLLFFLVSPLKDSL